MNRVFVTVLLFAVVGLTGCGAGQFYGPPAPTPPRPSEALGPGAPASWKAAAAYLAAHRVRVAHGMAAGILVAESSTGYVCMGYCHTWHGTAIMAGGRLVHLNSDQGDNGMAALAAPGDLIEFPAGNLPVDTAGDDGNDAPASVIVAQAVTVP